MLPSTNNGYPADNKGLSSASHSTARRDDGRHGLFPGSQRDRDPRPDLAVLPCRSRQDNALIHFLKDNREKFLGGVREMLQKHGRRGTPCRTPLRMTARLYMFLGQLRQRARHG